MQFLEELLPRLLHEGSRPDAPLPFAAAFSEGRDDTLELRLSADAAPVIYLTAAGPQMILVCELFAEAEVQPEKTAALHEKMLELNLALPLSSFGKIGGHYILFGALALDTGMHELILEMRTLTDNLRECGRLLRGYLR